MYRKRPNGSFYKDIVYGVTSVLPVILKFFPTIDHITQRLPHHLTIMFSFILQQLHRLFINRSQYACYIILAPLILYLVRLQAFQDTFSLYLIQLAYFLNKPFGIRILASKVMANLLRTCAQQSINSHLGFTSAKCL